MIMTYLADVILLLIASAGSESKRRWFRGITRLEKLVFLLREEHDIEKWITEDKPQFIPYKLGPYSREVYAAVDFLNTYGLIEDSFSRDESSLDSIEVSLTMDPESIVYEERRFRLTDDGEAAVRSLRGIAEQEALTAIEACYAQFGEMPLTSLLRHIYTKYPRYTGKSIIRDQVLGNL